MFIILNHLTQTDEMNMYIPSPMLGTESLQEYIVGFQVLLYAKHMYHEEIYRTIAPSAPEHLNIVRFSILHTISLYHYPHIKDCHDIKNLYIYI